jgi:hypothetical protein
MLTVQPTEGQFVAIWTNNGRVWSGTYKIYDGREYQWDTFAQMWCESELYLVYPDPGTEIQYFTALPQGE